MAKQTVIGFFEDHDAAERVVQQLVNRGFDRGDISLLANDAQGRYRKYQTSEAGDSRTGSLTADTQPAGHAASGAGIGAGIGALLGLAWLAVPGVGPVLSAGHFAAALGIGAAAGAATGGIIGALTEMGVPEEDAEHYAEGIRRGGTLVSVAADQGRVPDAAAIMRSGGAVNLKERAATWQRAGWKRFDPSARPLPAQEIEAQRKQYRTPPTAQPKATGAQATSQPAAQNLQSGEQAIPVVEEQLQVGKRQEEHGGVRIYSRVTSRPVEKDVQLREEHVSVQRRPADRPVSDADRAFEERTIEASETVERPVVSKEARIVEEVVVGKDVQQRTETVRDTVRRTDVQVDQVAAGKSSEAPLVDSFTQELARDQRYRGRDWDSLEPEVRRSFEQRYPGNKWEQFKEAIHRGYEKVREKV